MYGHEVVVKVVVKVLLAQERVVWESLLLSMLCVSFCLCRCQKTVPLPTVATNWPHYNMECGGARGTPCAALAVFCFPDKHL
jgi:hypothetical protein